jgi:uncharacterized tellurite resistance protein B-like protein
MLKTLKDLFDAFAGEPAADSPEAQEHALKLACAVLLVEVMRADPTMDAAERETILAALKQQFGLSSDESDRLLELARQSAKGAYDYHRFTSVINDHFSQAKKIQMVESMWQVAYADGHLDAHENHLISKVAGLLHVTHGEYIAAKLHAKNASTPARP